MQGRQQTLEEIAAEIAATGPFPLLELNPDLRKQNVYPQFAIDMLGLFARTCRIAEAGTAFLRLMTAAVEAEPMSYNQADETSLAAIAILKRHPELLFVKGMVTDHFGRKIFASPYQLLHGAGDVWALKQVHEEIIPHIDCGEAKAEVQFQEQFPNCESPFNPELREAALYDDRNIAQIEQVKENLKKIFAVITADPCTNGVATLPETEAAVEELRQLFAPKQGEVIKTGLHFPLAIMREISSVYDALFDEFALVPMHEVTRKSAQLSFFSREVIGAALAACTAVDSQCWKHGRKMDNEDGPDRRDGLFCRRPKGIPQELAPLKGKLGRTMFVDLGYGQSVFLSATPGYFDWYDKKGCVEAETWGGQPCWLDLRVRSLMWIKNASLGELMRPRREENASWCVIL
jgi:hypothetical protein